MREPHSNSSPEAEGRAQAARPPGPSAAAGGTKAATVVEILNDDMPFLVDSVLGELAGARARRASPAASHLQDASATRPAPCRRCSARATRTGTTATRKATSPSIFLRSSGRRPARSRQGAVGHPRQRARGGRRLAADAAAGAGCACQLEPGRPASRRASCARPSPSCAGWRPATSPSSARANTGSRATRERRSGRRPRAGLGVLRDPDVHVLRRGTELVAMTPEIRRFFFAPHRSSSPRPT